MKILTDHDKPSAIEIYIEGADGGLSDVAKERLNGLLDALSFCSAIPHGVRIFYDKEQDFFCLGKDDVRIPVGGSYARKVQIFINPDKLVMTAYPADVTTRNN